MFSSPPKMLLEFFNVFSVTHGRETAISWGLPAFLAASLLHVSKYGCDLAWKNCKGSSSGGTEDGTAGKICLIFGRGFVWGAQQCPPASQQEKQSPGRAEPPLGCHRDCRRGAPALFPCQNRVWTGPWELACFTKLPDAEMQPRSPDRKWRRLGASSRAREPARLPAAPAGSAPKAFLTISATGGSSQHWE